MARVHLAQYLDLDLDGERWRCHDCGHDLGDARQNYKRGLLVHDRDPSEVHRPLIEGEFTFSPNPELDPDPGVLLPRMRPPGGDRVPPARSSDHP